MHADSSLCKKIRERTLIIDCVTMEITQPSTGLKISGHGQIKINKTGCLYIEMIYTSVQNTPRATAFYEKIPADSIDSGQTLRLSAKDLDETEYTSESFSITSPAFGWRDSGKIQTILKSISFTPRGFPGQNPNLTHFEFSEHFTPPCNEISETKTDYGESISRNKISINTTEFNARFLIKGKYSIASIETTEPFDTEKLLHCLRLYVGLSDGSYIQPYFIKSSKKGVGRATIQSINNSLSRHRYSNPLPGYINIQGKAGYEHHHEMLISIIKSCVHDRKTFNSIYNNWTKAWHAGTSSNLIASLGLTTAIEGILNDIYIHKIKEAKSNDQKTAMLDKTKRFIKEASDLDEDAKRYILNSIPYMTNITPKTALSALEEDGFLPSNSAKTWSKLRNYCAHPKSTREENPSFDKNSVSEFITCINTLNTLIFGALRHNGYINTFELGDSNTKPSPELPYYFFT